MKKLLMLLSFMTMAFLHSKAADTVVWFNGSEPVSYQVEGKVSPVVEIALQMFDSDMQQVTGFKPVKSKKGIIRIIQGRGNDDGFKLSVNKKGQIVVEGHNARGAAYGLLELSRMAGVSPWVWWGDVVPEKKSRLELPSDFFMEHTPSVAYRGIFINDEDWSLRNWAWKHYENNGGFGRMGPKTYKAIFQLMLRLRANTIWPGMHTGTPGFFTIPGNKEMADSCGILIGTSHCEPLLRNNVAEWDHNQRGQYNYITNREQVQQYWIERLKEVKGSEEFFTIGMRGIHDGSMEGVKTKKEKLEGLQQVIDDQRELIKKYYSKDVEKVPQVFIPYKEVLEILESGLKVPDDVTLMWCDDNYGYMTRLSDAEQQKRSGGGGVYYHLSYWGRPHDYLWLTTTQPGLIYSEMKAAYDHNCKKLWIVNVHGELEPASACDHEYLESAFGNDQAFFLKTIGTVDMAEMQQKLVDNPRQRQNDTELLKTIDSISQGWFKCKLLDLPLEKKARLLPYVYRAYHTSISQLARCFGLDRDTVTKMIGKSRPSGSKPQGNTGEKADGSTSG